MASSAVVGGTQSPPVGIERSPAARELYTWLVQAHQATSPRAVFPNPRVMTLRSGVPGMGIVNRSPTGQVAELDEERITQVVLPRDTDSAWSTSTPAFNYSAVPGSVRVAMGESSVSNVRVVPRPTPTRPPDDHVEISRQSRWYARGALPPQTHDTEIR